MSFSKWYGRLFLVVAIFWYSTLAMFWLTTAAISLFVGVVLLLLVITYKQGIFFLSEGRQAGHLGIRKLHMLYWLLKDPGEADVGTAGTTLGVDSSLNSPSITSVKTTT